ncbi:uracil nucleotide/cysteinyl leukotriene receptor [Ictalurus furcatus]|uniref:uracil nucleotide/cysteinyl leukotriene receptor n=1 Tax=Ictalurus furcatus TaxID=66913 RepID=UPI002350FEAD|nr:uracil nucleotide/cysteinyl leukotriene receptor [Ictalurus furcatus]
MKEEIFNLSTLSEHIIMNFSVEKQNGIYSAGSHEENMFFATLYIIVFIVSVPCNMLALWVFLHSKGSSSSKVFLLNLAIADMCYVLVLPMRVIYHASNGDWPLGEASCRLVGFLFFINLYCSMYLITCISLDRLLAINLPLKWQSLRRSKNAKVICAILWALVTCSMVPVLFSTQTSPFWSSGRNVTLCYQLYLEKTSFKALVSTAVAISIPVVSLTVSYILIFLKLRVMTFHQRTSVQSKAFRMILLTLATFIVAFVPYHMHRFLYIERHTQGKLSDFEIRSLAFGNRITSALTCVSGIMDPVMYFFLARNYQKTLLKLCGRATKTDRLQSTT